MAVTGKTSLPIEPGPRKTGALVKKLPEMASATYPAGCIVSKSAGSVRMHTTSYVSVSIYGFALNSGKSGSADGVVTNDFYRAERDALYKVVMTGTLASSNLGQTIALTQNTAGVVRAVSDATASDSSVAYAVDFADGFTQADTNPVILFALVGAKIQEG